MHKHFGEAKEFAQWLKSDSSASRYRFVRLEVPDALTVSTSSEVDDPAREGRFVEVGLPSAATAMSWWHRVFENSVVDYWMFRDWGVQSLVVAANLAVWRPAESLYAKLGPADLSSISDERFQQIVGPEVASRMHGEVALVGVSTRLVFLKTT